LGPGKPDRRYRAADQSARFRRRNALHERVQPVPGERALRGIGGVIATAREIAEKVVSEQRVDVLRDLGARAMEARTAE